MVRTHCAAALLIAGALHMNAAPNIVEADFGKMPDGAAIHIYTLTNKKGVEPGLRIMAAASCLSRRPTAKARQPISS